jgi:signal transduction histidine kinase
LGNLIDNALKYSPKESLVEVLVSASNRENVQGIRFLVSNTIGSSGRPDEEKLFDKYYRAPRARNITGSGLGLFVARSFAVKLDGYLRCQIEDNQIRFELWMPTSRS